MEKSEILFFDERNPPSEEDFFIAKLQSKIIFIGHVTNSNYGFWFNHLIKNNILERRIAGFELKHDLILSNSYTYEFGAPFHKFNYALSIKSTNGFLLCTDIIEWRSLCLCAGGEQISLPHQLVTYER